MTVPGEAKGNDLVVNLANLKPRQLCLELHRKHLISRLADLE
jgi:hypothetical protein